MLIRWEGQARENPIPHEQGVASPAPFVAREAPNQARTRPLGRKTQTGTQVNEVMEGWEILA